eukprot:scaffold10635_cov13-Tisochrysis_lutea.AAC.1
MDGVSKRSLGRGSWGAAGSCSQGESPGWQMGSKACSRKSGRKALIGSTTQVSWGTAGSCSWGKSAGRAGAEPAQAAAAGKHEQREY